MNRRLHARGLALGAGVLALSTLIIDHVRAQDPGPGTKETSMTARAEGRFDVRMQPLAEDEGCGGFARMSLDKEFHGDLEGHSKGVMLAAQTEVKGSAGYVALERVTGELAGRSGSFVLQHSGMMGQGEQRLTIEVVTDSGTGELEGISGTLEIDFEQEGHPFVFTYSLPDEG